MNKPLKNCFLIGILWISSRPIGVTGFVEHARPSWGQRPVISRKDRHHPLKASKDNFNEVDFARSARNLIASTLLGLTLTLSPAFLRLPTDSFPFLEPAWAATEVAVDAPAAVKSEESKLLSKTKLSQPASLVDEVWTLIDKYYIDRSFQGQDWNDVKKKYLALEATTKNEDANMKLITEMVQSLGDKYSRVLDAKQYAAIQKYDLIGVGVTLMPNENKQIIVGAPPVAGSASARAGMKVGDFVVAINGIATEGRTAFDIIDQISEHPNAESVTMTVLTQGPDDLPGEGFKRELVMERAFVEVKNPVQYKISETRKDGTKVGFIRISEFNSLVKGRLEDALASLQKDGANSFVLDLRGNPGGAFQSAVEISSLFLDNRIATYVLDSNAVELPFRTGANQVTLDPKFPMAIWVDDHSASASEVLAGSLHDNCRAVVMGSKSFGKGLIQAVYGLKNGAGLVLTVAKYVTPNGTEIQGVGISPDITGGVPLFIPGLSTDSSKVDFADISRRLDPSICRAPER